MDKIKEIPVGQIVGHVIPEMPLFLSKMGELFIAMLGEEKYYELILCDLKNSIASDMVEDALGVQLSIIKEDPGLTMMYLSLLADKAQQLLDEMRKEVKK